MPICDNMAIYWQYSILAIYANRRRSPQSSRMDIAALISHVPQLRALTQSCRAPRYQLSRPLRPLRPHRPLRRRGHRPCHRRQRPGQRMPFPMVNPCTCRRFVSVFRLRDDLCAHSSLTHCKYAPFLLIIATFVQVAVRQWRIDGGGAEDECQDPSRRGRARASASAVPVRLGP
jgi:hypothetical protein